MSIGTNQDRLMSEINVTPFVDVMLVLLIIFMVAAPMMVQGVNVSLPETASGPLPADQDHLVVTIDAEGNVFINDYKVGVEFLQDKLIRILQQRTDRNVFLKADKSVPYGVVVHVMAELKGAGIEKIGMVTHPVLDKKASSDRKKRSK